MKNENKIKKDFDNWNQIKKKTDEKNRPIIKVGSVYWCRIGVNIGNEENGKGEFYQRPVIIIKKFTNNFILIAPLTSKKHTGDWYLKIEIKDEISYVILNQIKPIDTKRLEKNICEISENKIKIILEEYIKLLNKK